MAMYQEFYGLNELPFELTPNPRFLFLTPRHSEALSNLQYGLSAPKPITLLVGEAGTGKTTLLRAALESERCLGVRCVFLSNPVLTRAEFVTLIARQFGLGPEAAASKGEFLNQLEPVLLGRRRQGEITALVVDEAQSLPPEILEEIRLLANFETRDELLLPLVLAGQPEIAARLNDPSLRQLKQRIALRCEISALDLRETAAYISTRITIAGGEPVRLFTRDAVQMVYRYSHGIPRTVSVICDNALVSGFALRRMPVDREIVAEVCRDFDFRPGLEPATAPTESAGRTRTDRDPRPSDDHAVVVPFDAEAKPQARSNRGGFTFLGLAR